MDHLRDSVRLRGYGQRDPLVEYKREGYEMFQALLREMNRQIVNLIFHVNVQINMQPQPAQTLNMMTNKSDGGGGQQISSSADQQPAGIGRNDPCPCGSGKKYKKCGLLNTPEHQANLAKGGARHEAKVGG